MKIFQRMQHSFVCSVQFRYCVQLVYVGWEFKHSAHTRILLIYLLKHEHIKGCDGWIPGQRPPSHSSHGEQMPDPIGNLFHSVKALDRHSERCVWKCPLPIPCRRRHRHWRLTAPIYIWCRCEANARKPCKIALSPKALQMLTSAWNINGDIFNIRSNISSTKRIIWIGRYTFLYNTILLNISTTPNKKSTFLLLLLLLT